jgi:hypothetical protein
VYKSFSIFRYSNPDALLPSDATIALARDDKEKKIPIFSRRGEAAPRKNWDFMN